MHDASVILDPTDEREPIGRQLAARPGALSGAVGIVDISKPRGDVFCDELEALLRDRQARARRGSPPEADLHPAGPRPISAKRWRSAARR